MRLLEARFHPHRKSGNDVVVVGRVRCAGSRASVESPAQGDANDTPAAHAMLEKLRYLVRTSGHRPFRHLVQLHSDYWSFVEIESEGG
jgi:hypothetical protein